MKLLNKNKKLKYSKMFIDEKRYDTICRAYGSTLEQHTRNLEFYQAHPEATVAMEDLSIIYEVYLSITKIIRRRDI